MRILQSFTFFSIFLAIVGQKKSGKAIKPPSSAIHDVTDQLSILSRLVNGIAIQNGFDSNSITPDALLSELLHVGPGNVTLSEIQNLKTEGMAKDYEEIVKSASTMTKGSFGMEEVGSGFEILGKMADNLYMLKEAEALNLTDILEKATSANGVEPNLFTPAIHKIAENFDTIFDDKKLAASAITPMVELFKSMVTNFFEIQSKCGEFANYKSYLKKLWPMIGSTGDLHKLEMVASTAKTFNESFILISSSIKKMDELNKELASIDLVVRNLPKMKSVAKELKAMNSFFESVLSAKPWKRLLTVGFPNGVPDALQLFNELKSEWVLEKVASYNGKELENMIIELNGLRKFNKFSSVSDSLWRIMKTSNVQAALKKSEAIWSPIELTNLSSPITKNLRTSSSDLSKCFKALNVSSVTLDFQIFEERIKKLRALERMAVEANRLFTPLDKFPVLSNKAVILSLKTELQKIDENSKVFDLEESMKNIRLNPDFKNLRDAISNASSIIRELENSEILKPLDKLDSWESVSIMQGALKNTNLIDNLACLRNYSFNGEGLSQAVNFGSQVRSIGSNSKDNEIMISFIKNVVEFQSSYRKVLNFKSESLAKRATSTISRMENALTLSQDLGKGVHLLQKMAVVYDNKEILLEVSKSGNDVLDELKKLINTLDTSLFKAELEKTVKQLDNLESFSKTRLDGDLQQIGTIFDEASSISGISIESKLLADPVSVSFATSSNQNIQKTAEKFKKLGNLQLDFSNHRADFKTASLSVIKLKRFFDQLFVVPTVSTSEHHTDYSILQYSAFLLIFIPVGLAYYGTRVILKNRKLDDPNTYLHLLHTPEGQMKNVGYEYWNDQNPPLPIHTALKQQNWKKFKEEVDRGANVNAYFNEGFSLTTPVLYAQDVPKYAIYLIKNGADTSLLSSDFSKFSWDGPYKKYKNKKYRRRMPPLFKPTDFVVFPGVKWTMKENFPGEFKFREEFSANVVENWSGATHIVIPVDKDGSVIFTDEHWKENPNRALMSSFFDGTMMLKPEWIIASLNDRKNFAKDYKYQVQSVKIREKKYDTVLKIYQHNHERRLPFLYKIRAYFYGRDEDYWYHLARIVNLLGGQSLAHGHLPSKGVFRNFDGHLDCRARPFSFYRDDIGPMFILIDDPEVLREKHPHLFNNNWITFMDFYTFLEFVFKFEIRHWKLSGGKKQKDSLAPEDMLALDLGIDWAGENPRDLAREPKWDC